MLNFRLFTQKDKRYLFMLTISFFLAMIKLPPLNALRTFEAAARHLSFTAAADELNVTQAAVSHQVRTLEDWFGFALFRREGRQISLTEQGALLQPAGGRRPGTDYIGGAATAGRRRQRALDRLHHVHICRDMAGAEAETVSDRAA